MATYRTRCGRPAAAGATSTSASLASADPRERLHACIERLTRSGQASLDAADSAELKRLCRSDPQLIDLAHSLLTHRLVQDHAQIRLSAFQIVDLLFRRSARFRQLVLDRFEKLVGCVLSDNDASSPPPKPVSVFRQLGELALEAFIDWHEQYSVAHPKLVFAFRFLSQAHSARLSQVRARLASAAEQRLAESRRLAEKKRELLGEARQQFLDNEAELDACLATVANCLELLVPRPELFDVNALTSSSAGAANNADDATFDIVGEDFEAATEDERRRLHGLVSSDGGSYRHSVQLELKRPVLQRTPDNAELLEALQTRAGQLRNRLRPRLARWLALVERCAGQAGDAGGGDDELRDRLAGLLARADRLLGQVGRLRICEGQDQRDVDADADDEEEEEAESSADFETVGDIKEGFETEASTPAAAASASACAASTAAKVAPKRPASSVEAPSSSSTSSTSKSTAPTVPFGPDLLRWGANDEDAVATATMGYRMDDGGHSFGYRPLDGDESFEISGSRHMLTMRAMVYTAPEEPVRWACRHPLPGGGLCTRMDRLKCPFHGRIVPRDEAGRPAADATVEADNSDQKQTQQKKQQKQQKTESNSKDGGLVDIRVMVDNSRTRLAARVASKAALRKAAEDEAARRRRKMQEKFGDQFQYQFLN